jgi:hypothetical protein
MPNFGLKSIARGFSTLFRSNRRDDTDKVFSQAAEDLKDSDENKDKRMTSGGHRYFGRFRKGKKTPQYTAHQTLESLYFGTFRPMNLRHRRWNRR